MIPCSATGPGHHYLCTIFVFFAVHPKSDVFFPKSGQTDPGLRDGHLEIEPNFASDDGSQRTRHLRQLAFRVNKNLYTKSLSIQLFRRQSERNFGRFFRSRDPVSTDRETCQLTSPLHCRRNPPVSGRAVYKLDRNPSPFAAKRSDFPSET